MIMWSYANVPDFCAINKRCTEHITRSYAESRDITALVCFSEVSEVAMKACFSYFDILLTVHLSIILAINQLNAQNLIL